MKWVKRKVTKEEKYKDFLGRDETVGTWYFTSDVRRKICETIKVTNYLFII